MVQTVQETQSFNPDVIFSELEKINTSNPHTLTGGLLAFNSNHDVEAFYPFGYAILCQWKYIDGRKEVVPFTWTPTMIYGYPDNISTGSLRLPYWGINGLLTNPPQPPGEFIISSTALSPDYDGKFNLTWSDSEGADNYTIYMSDKSMSYISTGFDKFDYQRATSPFQFALTQGDYYFRVVAYNRTGETISSNSVHVNIPGPGPFDLYSDAKNPDDDGKFNLIWTSSERAVNYSVFKHNGLITIINETVEVKKNQTAISPLAISELSDGKYCFLVVAYNDVGSAISNNVFIYVHLTVDIVTIALAIGIPLGGVVGIISGVQIRKYYLTKGQKGKKVPKDKHKN